MEQETAALATYLTVLKFDDEEISYMKVLQDLIYSRGCSPVKVPKTVTEQRSSGRPERALRR